MKNSKKNSTGLKPYLSALYAAIKNYRPTEATISIDGRPAERVRFAILSVGNGKYIGGGMKAVPDAKPDDGFFDVVMVKPVPKIAILPLVALYVAGKHVSIGLASVHRCKRISLHCAGGMTLNLDGELRAADIARYEIFPQALSVRIPKVNTAE